MNAAFAPCLWLLILAEDPPPDLYAAVSDPAAKAACESQWRADVAACEARRDSLRQQLKTARTKPDKRDPKRPHA
jgi:hypothetical protein